jgi:hypothetical protein
MAECLICEGDFQVDETNEHRIVTVRTDRLDKGDRFGVCPACRENARIGAMIREMHPNGEMTPNQSIKLGLGPSKWKP